jgi:hypothetical protein
MPGRAVGARVSYVTTVMLVISLADQAETMPALQDRIAATFGPEESDNPRDAYHLADLADSEVRWGGTKRPEVAIWGAAYNYLDIDAFWSALNTADWRYPESVRVLVQHQDWDSPALYVWDPQLGAFACAVKPFVV